jgi:hypothetical protein
MENTSQKVVFVVGSEYEAGLLLAKLKCSSLSTGINIAINIAINKESDVLTERQKKISDIDFLLEPIHQNPIRIFKDKQRYQKHFKKNKLK